MSSIYAPPAWQADPANVKRVGIVDDLTPAMYVFDHKDPRGIPVPIVEVHELSSTDPAEIAGAAFTAGCGAVWILDKGRALSFDADDPHYVWHELSHKGAVAGLVAQVRGEDGKGKGMPLGIYAPHVNDAWGIAGAIEGADPRALAQGVMLAAFALGQQLRFSPSYTGNAILRRVLADYERRTGLTIPQPSEDTRKLCMEHPAHPIQWRGAMPIYGPALDTGEDITVYKYDRNMSYPSSVRDIPLGDPVPTTVFHEHRPGLYCIDLPNHFEHQWLWEPEMRHHVAYGNVIRIVEGYYWPKKKDIAPDMDVVWPTIFDAGPWQDRIWDARIACHAVESTAGKIAEAIVKKAGRATVGRLNQHRGRAVMSAEQAARDELRILSFVSTDEGELTGDVEAETALGRTDMEWPQAYWHIISCANERLADAGRRYAEHDTILMYVDALYTLRPHPELDCSPMQRGGWKLECAFQVPVSDLEELNTLDAQQLVKRFAAYQREKRNGKEETHGGGAR